MKRSCERLNSETRPRWQIAVSAAVLLAVLLAGCVAPGAPADSSADGSTITLSNIPEFADKPYVELYNNIPGFDESELKARSFESYSPLDFLGRCGAAYACVGRDLMPEGERGSIGQVKPSGWQTVKYDIVDGKYLYNRCHLIGYQLTAENANEKNLITGTRYLNVEGMLPFENMVADYIKETGNHVLYRVTPVFAGNNLLASGVQIEAESVEDGGDGILFNVYCYNSQPGITIDYATGGSALRGDTPSAPSASSDSGSSVAASTYVINENAKKFHKPECSGAKQIKAANRREFTGTREELLALGYEPCGTCKP